MNDRQHDAPLLLVAYQCGPGLGSVSQLGWQWFTGLAARREVCLVTHVRNRAAIEAAPDRPPGARVIYIDTEWFAGPLYRLSRRLFPRSEHAVFMLSQLDWFVFDAVALRTLRRELSAGAGWRLLHLVTPVTVSAPTRLHRLGLPVVRGPLNCGLPVPPGFENLMRDDAMGLSKLRVLPALVEALFGSLRHSAAVLVATAATRAALPKALRTRAVNMLENAVDPGRFGAAEPLAAPGAGRPLRVSFVGRLVPVKALPLLLKAIARLRGEGLPVTLDVVGDGPMAAPWRAEAAALGLADRICWHGALDAAGVARVVQASHVFCLPSVRESGGAVLLEAMACARPVIGMDFGGPAEVVDDAVGWKVAMVDEAGAVSGLTDALRQAHRHPEDAARRGRAAHQRVLARFTWAAKLDAAESIYRAVLSAASGAARPSRNVPAASAPQR
jgi:glycosyltransferase involved in cell wall biosynthesis